MWEAIVVSGLAVFAGVVWLVRLEGTAKHLDQRLNQVEKSHDHLATKVETLDSKAVAELTNIKVTLARIEGFMSNLKEKNNE